MKAFIISLAVVLGIFTLSLIYSFYIGNLTSSLIKDAEAIEIDTKSVQDFCDRWEKVQFVMKIASSHKETHRIDEVLTVLQEKVKNKTEGGFYEEKRLLIEYLHQIKEDESISLDSIV